MPQSMTTAQVATPMGSTSRLDIDDLARLNLLKGADRDEAAVLLQNCPVRTLAAGDVLVRAGESCAALYLVLSGCLRTQDPSSTVPVTFIETGDSLGELIARRRHRLDDLGDIADTVAGNRRKGGVGLGRASDVAALLKAAETAQQTAKRTGGNRVCG